jgi:hypothetical protein
VPLPSNLPINLDAGVRHDKLSHGLKAGFQPPPWEKHQDS